MANIERDMHEMEQDPKVRAFIERVPRCHFCGSPLGETEEIAEVFRVSDPRESVMAHAECFRLVEGDWEIA